ncbi:ectoine/hydroxyectoine ABC transporter permease subunit EhuD [Saccharomonospora saliphila]|uniref:ectoine/hydroxyectoine ABC transporter permease subunit EhuD n=1 Tax=Saccharomonospora saliphila TaxID=369829 RepID=UPI000377C4C3|nr:ectoine/hydroxyectoine ABC transporter permease subunit EhuD [Saccharomonospora saliphila]
MNWNWDRVTDALPFLLDGILVTLRITVLGALLAYALGLVFALIRRMRPPVLNQVVYLFVELVRSTPLLIQVFVFFYLLQPAFGLTWSPFITGVLALGVHYSGYTSEVYRAGIEAVPKEQWEAATALSLPRPRVWSSVILPQAVPRVLPSLGNYTISMFKETPLLLAIGVADVLNQAREAASQTFSYVEPVTMAGVFFLAVSYPASILVRKLERRVGTV